MESKVFVFGSGDCGQLGLGEDVDCCRKPRQHSFFDKLSVVSLAAGGLHSLALAVSGSHLSSSQTVVYSWGCNDEKALGHDAPEFSVGTVDFVSLLEAEEHVTQVTAGDSISAVLTNRGRVFTWGAFRDSKGLLGHNFPSQHRRSTVLLRKGAISTASVGSVKSSQSTVATGPHPSSDKDQAVFMQSRPIFLEALSSFHIVQIAAGSNHLLALASDGSLFAWGAGEQGQLGRRVLERHKLSALHPSVVTPRLTIDGVRLRVKRVICGSYHTILLASASKSKSTTSLTSVLSNDASLSSLNLSVGSSSRGSTPLKQPPVMRLFTKQMDDYTGQRTVALSMGLNNYGQLGLGDRVDRITPEIIPESMWPEGAYPIDAAAGEHHSLILLNNGEVYSFGRSDSGQLGVAGEEEMLTNQVLSMRFSPKPLLVPVPGFVTRIAAGGNHCMAVVESLDGSSKLYTWGYGEMHQLGHGPDEIEYKPRLVQCNFPGNIVQACAGGQHSLVLCANEGFVGKIDEIMMTSAQAQLTENGSRMSEPQSMADYPMSQESRQYESINNTMPPSSMPDYALGSVMDIDTPDLISSATLNLEIPRTPIRRKTNSRGTSSFKK